MGNDYCTGIRCTGGNNRDKLFEIFIICNGDTNVFIHALNKLNKLNSDKIDYYIPTNFLEKYNESKILYKNMKVIIPSSVEININLPNILEINNYTNLYEMHKNSIKNLLNSMTKLYYNFYPLINELKI